MDLEGVQVLRSSQVSLGSFLFLCVSWTAARESIFTLDNLWLRRKTLVEWCCMGKCANEDIPELKELWYLICICNYVGDIDREEVEVDLWR